MRIPNLLVILAYYYRNNDIFRKIVTVGYFWLPIFNLCMTIELYFCIDQNISGKTLPMEFVSNALANRALSNAIGLACALMSIENRWLRWTITFLYSTCYTFSELPCFYATRSKRFEEQELGPPREVTGLGNDLNFMSYLNDNITALTIVTKIVIGTLYISIIIHFLKQTFKLSEQNL